MESPTSSSRVYKFDEFFLGIFKVEFIRRKSPSAPLTLCRSKIMFLALFVLVILTIGVAMRLIFNLNNLDFDFREISAICEAGSVFVMTIGRASSFFIKHESFNRLLRALEKLFPITTDEQRRLHLEVYAKEIINKNKFMQILITSSCFAYLAIPVVKSVFGVVFSGESYEYQYPFISWYPFDPCHLVYYPFIYILHALAGLSAAGFYFYEEFMFSSTVMQLCMHYRYFGELLSAIDAAQVTDVSKCLGGLIRHQYILEGLQDDINDSFSISTFFGFTVIKISICMFFFSTVSGPDLLEDLPQLLCVIALVVPVYLRCHTGTTLSEANENVLEAIYSQNWYEGSLKYRKAVLIMMTKANRPKALRASQLRQICMEYFKEIMVDTYQVFMFFFNSSH